MCTRQPLTCATRPRRFHCSVQLVDALHLSLLPFAGRSWTILIQWLHRWRSCTAVRTPQRACTRSNGENICAHASYRTCVDGRWIWHCLAEQPVFSCLLSLEVYGIRDSSHVHDTCGDRSLLAPSGIFESSDSQWRLPDFSFWLQSCLW